MRNKLLHGTEVATAHNFLLDKMFFILTDILFLFLLLKSNYAIMQMIKFSCLAHSIIFLKQFHGCFSKNLQVYERY